MVLLFFNGCNRSEPVYIDGFKIIAHRGGCTYYPENSIASIKHALSIGVDAIEIDIRLTKDNKIVVCHDDAIGRVTNGTGKISNMTLKQLQSYRLLFQNGLTEETIPTFEDVLNVVNHQAELYVEIKEYSPVLIKKLVDILQKYQYFDDISIISFSYVALQEMYKYLGQLHYKYIPYNDANFEVLPCLSYDFLDGFIFDSYILNRSVFLEVDKLNKSIDIYTIDDLSQLSVEHFDWVRGIITNYPEYWIKLRRK